MTSGILKSTLLLATFAASVPACGGEADDITNAASDEPKLRIDSHAAALGGSGVEESPLLAPCGLSSTGPVGGQYNYTIHNCHDYAVDRKLDHTRPIIAYPDGPCHHNIRPHSQVSDWISIPDSVAIVGIKDC